MSPVTAVMTARQLAKRWKVTEGHLANLRCYKKFPQAPKFFRVGRAIRYPIVDIMLYEEREK